MENEEKCVEEQSLATHTDTNNTSAFPLDTPEAMGRKRVRTRVSKSSSSRKSYIAVATSLGKSNTANIISKKKSSYLPQKKEPQEDTSNVNWDTSLESMFERLSKEADEVIGRTMQMLDQKEEVYPREQQPHCEYRESGYSYSTKIAIEKPIYPFEHKGKVSQSHNTNKKSYKTQRGNKYQNNAAPIKIQESPKEVVSYPEMNVDPNAPIRLNKYLANAGVCSRRVADEMIVEGRITVNGEVVTQLGHHVTRQDQIAIDGKIVSIERKVYILLNKPSNCITSLEDPNGRLTAADLVRNACSERIYPVGRLDRNTTGLLLLTNDGNLAEKLMHPKYEKKKIYQATLNKPVSIEHMEAIASGIELEDGEIHADAISYVNENDLSIIGIEIHSGRNRIVRRIFQHFGYRVKKLDRVYFAGLSKKDLPRGHWRYLTEVEVRNLRHDFCE